MQTVESGLLSGADGKLGSLYSPSTVQHFSGIFLYNSINNIYFIEQFANIVSTVAQYGWKIILTKKIEPKLTKFFFFTQSEDLQKGHHSRPTTKNKAAVLQNMISSSASRPTQEVIMRPRPRIWLRLCQELLQPPPQWWLEARSSTERSARNLQVWDAGCLIIGSEMRTRWNIRYNENRKPECTAQPCLHQVLGHKKKQPKNNWKCSHHI